MTHITGVAYRVHRMRCHLEHPIEHEILQRLKECVGPIPCQISDYTMCICLDP